MTIGCHGLVWTGTFDEAGLAAAAERTRRAGFSWLGLTGASGGEVHARKLGTPLRDAVCERDVIAVWVQAVGYQ